jgi:hypothetical protein
MGNWGFIIDNSTNEPIGLHPLMDFNHSFEEYDNLEGGRCLTVLGVVSQREAALEAVTHLGDLSMLKAIPYHLFDEYGFYCEKVVFIERLKILDKI